MNHCSGVVLIQFLKVHSGLSHDFSASVVSTTALQKEDKCWIVRPRSYHTLRFLPH